MLKLLVFGDVHAPFHDKKALACMLNAMAWWKPDATICMGDLFDFYACSFYDTAPSRWKRLKDELEDARNVVGDSNSIAGADRTFIKGNHEDRLDRYIAKSARALDGLVDFANAVGLDKSWQVVEYGNFIKIGKVLYTHDLDYAGPYFAQRAVMDARHSIVIGHVHRIGMCVEGDITNGTYLGKNRLTPNMPTVWKPGQPLRVGQVIIQLQQSAQPYQAAMDAGETVVGQLPDDTLFTQDNKNSRANTKWLSGW